MAPDRHPPSLIRPQERRRGARTGETTEARERVRRELRLLGVSYHDEPRLHGVVGEFVVALRKEGVPPEPVVRTLRALVQAVDAVGGSTVPDTVRDRLVAIGIKVYFDRASRSAGRPERASRVSASTGR